MRIFYLFAFWLATQLAIVSVAFGDTATVPIPIDGKNPMVGYDRSVVPRGILLIREVYDYRGRKVVLEESTDAKTARPQMATAPKPAKETRTETPTYKFHGGNWFKWNGARWVYCEECVGLPGPQANAAPVTQRPFYIAVMTAPVVAASSTSYPVSTRTVRTTIGVSGAVSLGGTRRG